jgi:short subunit dehydrogenase-like uncharacterized protein
MWVSTDVGWLGAPTGGWCCNCRLVSDRDLSVVVFGATGVTGRHVAAYLAERAEEVGASWAVGGRDIAKIDRVLGEIGAGAPETIFADVEDPASLAAMASRTKVVLDLVGPYTLYGTPVIEACVASGTHYADLTGEIPFVSRTISNFHERAVAADVKVVQASGFEALPPDLGVLLAAETAWQRWSEDLEAVEAVVRLQQPPGRVGLGDVASGGTLQGLPAMLVHDGAEKWVDPAALVPDPDDATEVRRKSPITIAPRVNANGDVIAPMVAAPFVNPAVIQRTAALVAAERGGRVAPFRYREGLAMPGSTVTLPLRYVAATALAGAQSVARALVTAQPSIRHGGAQLMRRLLPSSGFGPSGNRLDDWTWQFAVDARTVGGHYVRVDVDADGHPGYLSTARMLGEAGLMLAEEGTTPARAGCLTPATALGTASLERFGRAGVRFAVSS